MNKLRSIARKGSLVAAGILATVATARAEMPAEITESMANVDTVWDWAKGVAMAVVGFGLLIWIVKKARK